MDYLLIASLGLAAGIVAGQRLEALRWRGNAGRIQRIESGGALFKVITDDAYHKILNGQ